MYAFVACKTYEQEMVPRGVWRVQRRFEEGSEAEMDVTGVRVCNVRLNWSVAFAARL